MSISVLFDPPAGAPPPPSTPVRLAALARRSLPVSAAVAVAAAALALIFPAGSGLRPWGAAALLAWGGLALLALRLAMEHQAAAMGALAIGGVGVVMAAAVTSGQGVQSPVLLLLPLLAGWAGAFASRRAWVAVAVLTAAGLIAFTAPEAAEVNAALQAAVAVAAALGAGLAVAARLRTESVAADAASNRFSQLLSLAADAVWELDAQGRLTALNRIPRRGGRPRPVDLEQLGHLPWEITALGLDAEALDRLQADLENRAPFRDLPVSWTDEEDRVRYLRVSGEPRWNDDGGFAGFWGVARDVSPLSAVREALLATEDRFQDLFDHLPTALLLHRDGIVLEANPAAVALFGATDAMPLEGRPLLELFEPGESRDRARAQMLDLEDRPLGEAAPVAEFRMRAAPAGRGAAERTLRVRGTGVRTDAGDGPATLAILLDETDRRAIEDAMHRSDALLSHLVASSPDPVMLLHWPSGQLVTVNRAFERLLRWEAAGVAGQRIDELGLWPVDRERTALWAALAEDAPARERALQMATRDGYRLEVRVSGARFTSDRREYAVLTVRDVTASERQRMEREAILETVNIGIALTRNGRFVVANPRFEQLLGWPQGSLEGEPWHQGLGDAAAAERIASMAAPALARGESARLEQVLRRRDGSKLLARLAASAVDRARPVEGGTVWTLEDISAQRENEAALAAARLGAESASRAKSAFLANTSHELRTPLNGIIGLARLAREPSLDAGRRLQYLDQISDCAQALGAIINDILDLSRIESGRLTLAREPFDVPALVRGLQVGYTVLASARHLALRVEVDPDAPARVVGDAVRVRQILSHYLSNALKFTPAGEVRLRVRRRNGGGLRLEVHDTGPGIDRETRERLFRPFSQGDTSATRPVGGTGLGLSLCHRIAELMGGQVGVDSTPGRGSCFWAELPLPDAPPMAATPAAVPDVGGARVLMVEDNSVNMMIGVALLEQWGVNVEQARDGQEAVDAVARAHAQGRPFDAVLMDVQMPRMGGYEATRILRARYGADVLPILALTAAGFEDERDEAIAAGMNDFLPKPIDPERLRAALARWVGWRSALRV